LVRGGIHGRRRVRGKEITIGFDKLSGTPRKRAKKRGNEVTAISSCMIVVTAGVKISEGGLELCTSTESEKENNVGIRQVVSKSAENLLERKPVNNFYFGGKDFGEKTQAKHFKPPSRKPVGTRTRERKWQKGGREKDERWGPSPFWEPQGEGEKTEGAGGRRSTLKRSHLLEQNLFRKRASLKKNT